MQAENTSAAPPVVFCALCLTLLLAHFSPSAQAADCPNESIRAAQGAAALALPECRAYELATPGSKPFVSSSGGVEGARASSTGNGLAYFTRYPADHAERSGQRYVAKRGSSSWSVEDAAPQSSPTNSTLFACEQAVDFSPDLSQSILSDGWDPAEGTGPGTDPDSYCFESEELLAPGAPRGYANLYLRNGNGPYQLINHTPEGVLPANAILRSYTPDLDHIIFQSAAQLTEGAPLGTNLYLWSEGTLHLVGFLPNGDPTPAKLAGGGRAPGEGEGPETPTGGLASVTHAVSDDGESVFFYANGNLYLRRNATQPPTAGGTCSLAEPDNACTVQVDRKQGGAGASGGGVFWSAAADGSRVLFAAASPLTADSKATVDRPDLFEYDVETGLLKDRSLTGGTERGNVRGFSGVSEDGSRLYFVARGVLAGSGTNGDGKAAQSFSPNLYLLDGTEVSFVTTLAAADETVWQRDVNDGLLATATSPSGRSLIFASVLSLTGFESTPDDPGDCATASCRQIFLYDAQDGQIECVSCGSGESPAGDSYVPGPYRFSGKPSSAPAYFARQAFDDGRVFFTTENALAPQDVNGVKDVYEYREGQLRLISTGTATGDSVLFDADPSGANVFFATAQRLVPSDTDNGISVYDARVGGGFDEPPPAPACEGESCRGPVPVAPVGVTPASLGFAGAEEGPRHTRRSRCRRGFVKHKGSCRKKRQRAKKRQSGKRRAAKRASVKRRAVR